MGRKNRRPQMRLRLSGGVERDGEIGLDELARVAEETQRLVTRLARGLTDQRGPGRTPAIIADATRLFLVGLTPGSTVLEIAGAEPALDALSAENMPGDLGEVTLALVADSVRALSEEEPVLPPGMDSAAVDDLDKWLRRLRPYDRVSLDVALSSGPRAVEFAPIPARQRLGSARPQPSLPFVSSSHQALYGRLYALNLRTGSFSIEDDTGHSIRLSVPEDLRPRAAQMVDSRVRAVGNARLDERRRLAGFDVANLEPVPESMLPAQGEFFHRHELVPKPPVGSEIEAGIIPDLTADEIESFMAALSED